MKTRFRCGMLLVTVGAFGFQACGGGDAGFTGAGTAGSAQGGSAGLNVAGGGSVGGASGSAGVAGGPAGASNAGSGGSAGAPLDDGAAGEAGNSSQVGAAGMANGGSGALGGGGSASGGRAGSGGGPIISSGAAGVAGEGGFSEAGEGGMGGALEGPRCGNHVREGAEQCDDGNLTNLDACRSNCQFEQSQRANWFKVQFLTDASCTKNAFGAAFSGIARTVLQGAVDDRVASGALNLLFSFSNLADLSGSAEGALTLGVLSGTPRTLVGYDGTSDLDWWYAPLATSIDSSRTPLSKLAASITSGVLNTTPGTIQIPLLSATPLTLSQADIRLPIGASSKPTSSTGNAPGHLASEQLSPTLTSFASAGKPNSAGAGELCGNLSAASLRAESIPIDYTVDGATPCNQGYAATSTYLDVLIGGCTIGLLPVLSPTQPDQVDASVPQPGAGGPYRLTASAAHVVTGCRDQDNTVVGLTACLNAAAFSSAFKFTSDRVIIK